jgi:hypothetical protein
MSQKCYKACLAKFSCFDTPTGGWLGGSVAGWLDCDITANSAQLQLPTGAELGRIMWSIMLLMN